MTFDDMQVVERYLSDSGYSLPVMLSTEYDRVDIDTYGCVPGMALSDDEVDQLVDELAQVLGRKGYLWDVWREPGGFLVHVSEREREAET